MTQGLRIRPTIDPVRIVRRVRTRPARVPPCRTAPNRRRISPCLIASRCSSLFALVPAWEGLAARGQEDDLAKELPRIQPLEPDAALKSFRLHEGFRLQTVAVGAGRDRPGERRLRRRRPALRRSRCAAIRTPRSRPPATSAGSKTATATASSSGARSSSTACRGRRACWPYDGGVFIAVPPDILYAKDTDGDGVADVKKVVFTGFGTQNVQALVNGLPVGPRRLDLRHLGGQRRRHPQPGAARTTSPSRSAAATSGSSPTARRFEATSGGGQFGHAFDDWGHRFTCNNSNHIRQILLPARYLERNPALAAPAVLDRHRRRRVRRAGLPDQPGRALADRPDPPARGRSRVCQAAPADRAGRHRLLHLGHRRDDLSGDRLSRPSTAATPSSATSGATSSIARPSRRTAPKFLATRADREGRVPGLDGQLVPARQLRQHPRRHAPDPGHVPRDDRAPGLDPRADQEAPRPDQRQGPRAALQPRPRRLQASAPSRP